MKPVIKLLPKSIHHFSSLSQQTVSAYCYMLPRDAAQKGFIFCKFLSASEAKNAWFFNFVQAFTKPKRKGKNFQIRCEYRRNGDYLRPSFEFLTIKNDRGFRTFEFDGLVGSDEPEGSRKVCEVPTEWISLAKRSICEIGQHLFRYSKSKLESATFYFKVDPQNNLNLVLAKQICLSGK
jgi:hypothetical protein